jgi:microcystin-dependent protein
MAQTPYIGMIFMFGGNFAPTGYALCQGQLLSISQNTALFAILGTQFGGDGIQTFGLPNLQGRMPLGTGQGSGLPPFVVGQIGGSQNVTLLTSNIPQHNHLINASSAGATAGSPQNAFLASSNDPTSGDAINTYGTPANTSMAPTALTLTGSNLPVAVQNPYQAVSFIIALQGIFPSHG